MRSLLNETTDNVDKCSLPKRAVFIFLLPGRAFLFLMYINTVGGLRKAMRGVNHRPVPRLTLIWSCILFGVLIMAMFGL